VIELIEDMPAGTVGLHAGGEIGADDYRQVLEPALREAADAGEIRMLYLLDADFDLEPGAVLQDAKVGLTLGIGHRSAWRRSAVVTDVDWIRRSMHLFAWMVPGELRVFGIDGLEEAKAWVASKAASSL
jgi:hypothetical protein